MRLRFGAVLLCSALSLAFYASGCDAAPEEIAKKEETTAETSDKNSADQRYLIFGVWNFNITSPGDVKTIAQAALDNGFTAIRIHIPWFHVETQPGVYNFEAFNKQLDCLVNEMHVKVVITADFTRKTGADKVISPNELQYDSDGVLCSGGAFFDRSMISFASPSAVKKANDFYRALCENVISRYKENILLISPVFSQYAESEYWCSGNYDYSDHAKKGFVEFLKTGYPDIEAFNTVALTSYPSFDNIEPPVNFAGSVGLLWYQYRHFALKAFIDSLCDTQRAIDGDVKIALQFGSVFDEASVLRGTLAFGGLAEKADVLWVDDGPKYDHDWSMDYIGSSLKAQGKQIANEIDGYYHIQNGVCTIEDYLDQGIESYLHGADYLTVANWSIDGDFYDNAAVFQTIAQYADGAKQVSERSEQLVLEVSLYELFAKRSAAKYINQYNKLTQDGKYVCNIIVTDDLTRKIPERTAGLCSFPASFSGSEQKGELFYRSYDRKTGVFGEMKWSESYQAWQGEAEFCLVGNGIMHPDILDSAIVFSAPRDGNVTYAFSAAVADINSDGVKISVLKNGEEIFPPKLVLEDILEAELTVEVQKGDEIAFICNKNKSSSFDSANVTVDIRYNENT